MKGGITECVCFHPQDEFGTKRAMSKSFEDIFWHFASSLLWTRVGASKPNPSLADQAPAASKKGIGAPSEKFSAWRILSFRRVPMKRSSKTISDGGSASLAFAVLVLIAAIRVGYAGPAPRNSDVQIECTTPDGRVVAVPTVTSPNQDSDALLSDNETLSCTLQEGRTTFVIKLPATSQRDRVTFVNENAAAAGELKISVSNDQLPATSPKWVEVGGNISFSHKRLFNVSMVGVEARYMKLSFDVAKGVRIAAVER